jgi:UDP:flavonoid glycosyltransferase YjiC (YdhE family)
VVLRAGVPQLLFPDTLESLLLTYRLRSAGVARSQRGSAGADAIAAAICAMLADEAAIACARRTGARYAGYSPVAATKHLVDALLGAAGHRSRENDR